MSTNNSNKTEVINNSNKTEVTNVFNQVVECNCKEAETKEQVSEPVFKTYAEEIAYKRGFVDGDLFAEERIIKLLKKEAKGFDFDRNFYAEAVINELIGKVKGKNK